MTSLAEEHGRPTLLRRNSAAAVVIAGGLLFFAGSGLRLFAYWLAWPEKWQYNGPRENTNWAIEELAYRDVSFFLMGLGVLLITVAAQQWLKSKE